MSYQRIHFTAAERAARQQHTPVSWPALSLVVICVIAAVAPAGLLTAMNLYLLLLVGIGWLATRATIEQRALVLVAPFLALVVVGGIGGVAAGHDTYLQAKDAWYITNPMTAMLLGWVIHRLLKDDNAGLRAFVYAGLLAALLHTLRFAFRPQLLLESASTIRMYAGQGYFATAVAIILLVGWHGRWRQGLGLSSFWGTATLVLCTLSCVASFSRTIALVVGVGLLAMAGFFSRREWLRVGSLVAIALLAIGLLQATVDTRSMAGKNSFLGKMARSLDEMSVREYNTEKEINDNWRGYETARALDTWQRGNTAQQLFGLGFGAQVDLGRFQNLTGRVGEEVRFIPIFHNGYLFLLVKTGIVGVIAYTVLLGWIYRIGRRTAAGPPDDPATLRGRALQACALVLGVSTWVISGAFNKFGMIPFLLFTGYLLATATPREKP